MAKIAFLGLGQMGAPMARRLIAAGIERDFLLLLDDHFAAGTFDLNIAFEDGELCCVRRSLDAEVSRAFDLDLFAGEVQCEPVFAQPVDVGHPLNEVDYGDVFARIVAAERAELHAGVRSQAHGAAVFELDFGAASVAGANLCALGDRKIEKCILKSHAGVFIDLDRTLHVAQANDACLRISQSGQR